MKKNEKGFTLIEILVVIAILGILAIGAGKINFNQNIDKQNSLMFSNNIYTNIETIRNNSLLGKGMGIGTIMYYPDKWIVRISNIGSGSINNLYLTGGTSYAYNELKVNFINNFSKISSIKCKNLDETISNSGNTIDIEFSGKNITLSGCPSPNDKILEITTSYKNFTNTIKLNKVTGVMEKN